MGRIVLQNDFIELIYFEQFQTLEGGWIEPSRRMTLAEYKETFLAIYDMLLQLKKEDFMVRGELIANVEYRNPAILTEELKQWQYDNITSKPVFPVEKLAVITPDKEKKKVDKSSKEHEKFVQEAKEKSFDTKIEFVMKFFGKNELEDAQTWVRSR